MNSRESSPLTFPVPFGRLLALGPLVGVASGTLSYILQGWLIPSMPSTPQGQYVWVVLFNILSWTVWLASLPVAWMVADPEQVRVQRIGEVARTAARIDRVGGAVQQRPLHEDEVLPRLLVSLCARAGEREVFQVQGREIPFDVTRGAVIPQRPLGAGLERAGEPILRHAPAPGFGLPVEPIDQVCVDPHQSTPGAGHGCSVIWRV